MNFHSETLQIEETTVYLYGMLSSAVTLFYDILVTLDQEINNVWGRKLSVAGILFLLNRYLNVGVAIANLLSFFPVVQTSLGYCKTINIIIATLQIASDVNSAAFSAFRVWAIWGRNRAIFGIIMISCLIAPILNVYRIIVIRFVGASPFPNAYGGCIWFSALSTSTHHTLIVAARSCAIFADTLILGATLVKTIRIKREAMRVGIPAKLTTMLIRDGSLWWGALLVVNTISIVVDRGDPPGNASTSFVDVMHSIMLSHFVLSLRKLSDPLASRELEISSPPDIFDSMGGTLNFAQHDDEDYDDLVFDRITTRISSRLSSFRRLSFNVNRESQTTDVEYPLDSLSTYTRSTLSLSSRDS